MVSTPAVRQGARRGDAAGGAAGPWRGTTCVALTPAVRQGGGTAGAALRAAAAARRQMCSREGGFSMPSRPPPPPPPPPTPHTHTHTPPTPLPHPPTGATPVAKHPLSLDAATPIAFQSGLVTLKRAAGAGGNSLVYAVTQRTVVSTQISSSLVAVSLCSQLPTPATMCRDDGSDPQGVGSACPDGSYGITITKADVDPPEVVKVCGLCPAGARGALRARDWQAWMASARPPRRRRSQRTLPCSSCHHPCLALTPSPNRHLSGTIGDGYGCTPCTPGTASDLGATACTISCGAGYYAPGGSSRCLPCPPATYSSGAANKICTQW